MGRFLSLPKDDFGQQYTDRDILRDEIERQCVIHGKLFLERDTTITVIHGPKYIFTPEGELKSIIMDGKSYGPGGKNKSYQPPKRLLAPKEKV